MQTNKSQTTYDIFANEFNNTRYSIWRGVKEYLDKLPQHYLVAEIGCGNGKNLKYRKDLQYIACDVSLELLHYTKNNNNNIDILAASGLNIPFRDETYDATICIAVLHHIQHENLRHRMLKELIRVTKPHGSLLITVWSASKDIPSKWISLDSHSDYMVPWNDPPKAYRFYHLFSQEEILNLLSSVKTLISSYEIYEECHNWYISIHKI